MMLVCLSFDILLCKSSYTKIFWSRLSFFRIVFVKKRTYVTIQANEYLIKIQRLHNILIFDYSLKNTFVLCFVFYSCSTIYYIRLNYFSLPNPCEGSKLRSLYLMVIPLTTINQPYLTLSNKQIVISLYLKNKGGMGGFCAQQGTLGENGNFSFVGNNSDIL